VVNAKEAARVREIFQLYLSLGSLLPVVDELARRGWRNKEWNTKKGEAKGGRPFDKGTLYTLLTSVKKSAARSPAATLPRNSQFLRPIASCFINCSTSLLSIGRRPSVKYNCKASY
jgi:hypothetical protein